MATKDYQGKKIEAAAIKTVQDTLAVEAALQIIINKIPFTTTMRTPGEDAALIRGLLFSEDVYRGITWPWKVTYHKKNEVIRVANLKIAPKALGAGYQNSRRLLAVSSCGICGREALDELSEDPKALEKSTSLPTSQIPQLFAQMQAQQNDFLRSGGSHAAAIFSAEGQLLSLMEDIGRHNAVDKAIGALLEQEKLDQAACLLLSGRISYELVAKAYHAQIPILAAVSAPSSLAVDYARKLGLTLLGFCRGERVTCYANPWRLV